jgi:hypothetical protein
MSITVETRYRVTVDGTTIDLDEQAATTLMEALQQRLVSRIDVTPVETRVHVLSPERAPLAEPAAVQALPEPARERPPMKYGDWTKAECDELRRLHADGLVMNEIAARLGRPHPATQAKALKLGLRRLPSPESRAKAVPVPAPPAPAPASLLVRSDNSDGWTREQTKTLIHLMASGSGLKAAMVATGHSFLSCERRWRHLKEAGQMTLAQLLASPESTIQDVTP